MQLATYVISEGVFSEATPEGYIVMSPTGQMYRFNGIGEYILARCDGRHAVNQIVDSILNDFNDASAEVVVADVNNFVGFLVERQLIQQLDANQESLT